MLKFIVEIRDGKLELWFLEILIVIMSSSTDVSVSQFFSLLTFNIFFKVVWIF